MQSVKEVKFDTVEGSLQIGAITERERRGTVGKWSDLHAMQEPSEDGSTWIQFC